MFSMTWWRRGVAMEAAGWRSLARWVTRRPAVPADEAAYGYDQPNKLLLWVFIVTSAIEVAVVDLIVHQWPVARAIALVIGVWGLLFMLGFLAAIRMNPHSLGPRGLTVRSGGTFTLSLPWATVASVRVLRTSLERSTALQHRDETLSVAVMSQTNVAVMLTSPVEIELPSGRVSVRELRLWADDPAGLVAAARATLEPVA
jgi:hypothetical protein